jgi:hypothetical protein
MIFYQHDSERSQQYNHRQPHPSKLVAPVVPIEAIAGPAVG